MMGVQFSRQRREINEGDVVHSGGADDLKVFSGALGSGHLSGRIFSKHLLLCGVAGWAGVATQERD